MKLKLLETPAPPYFAVIFKFQMEDIDLTEYRSRSGALMERAIQLPGFYGEEAIRLENGQGLSISYWQSLEAIKEWRADPDHTATRAEGIRSWYNSYDLRVARINRAHGLTSGGIQRAAKTGADDEALQVVLFSSLLRHLGEDDRGYGAAAEEMARLGERQEGYRGLDSLRDEAGFGLTATYWQGAHRVKAWGAEARHREVQRQGRDLWYSDYELRAGNVVRQKKWQRRV